MSISGYAELIENGMVQMGDIPEFAGRIHQEDKSSHSAGAGYYPAFQTGRRSWRISGGRGGYLRTDGGYPKDAGTCGTKKISRLQWTAKGIMLDGVRQILYEMFYNLMDNGIKYNVEHGWMKVHIGREQGKIFWQVEDGGIGIAQEDQERIYERFYRVDKSHSRQTGGTGLGFPL